MSATDASFATDPRIALLHIGRGGWSGFHRRVEGSCVSRCETQHYGDTWHDGRDWTPDAVAVDTTTIPEDRIVSFAVSGPMVDVDLSPGQRQPIIGPAEPWQDDGTPFGNAGGMDHVAPDVYVTIARRFGARVFDPQAVPLAA